jgi:predicted glycosyltransferase
MNIFIDTGHPVHIHFFNPIAKQLEKNGYNVFFAIREKDCSLQLAKSYQLHFISKGKGSYSLFLKPLYLLRSVYQLYAAARRTKTDLFLSFASPYAGIVSRIMNKPHIVFDDTEPDPIVQWVYRKVSDTIITPTCFQKDFGEKHIKINGYKELAYLNSGFFSVDPQFKNQLGFKNQQDYILVRLVNHGAMHDKFTPHWNIEEKISFIQKLAETYSVVISSETALPEGLEKYQFRLSETLFHQAIANAKLVVGESATVAAESAVLGVPTVFIDFNTRGYIDEIESNYHLIRHYKPTSDGLKLAEDFIQTVMQNNAPENFRTRGQVLISEKTNMVDSFVEIIEKFLR